jgi:hypothetical protein
MVCPSSRLFPVDAAVEKSWRLAWLRLSVPLSPFTTFSCGAIALRRSAAVRLESLCSGAVRGLGLVLGLEPSVATRRAPGKGLFLSAPYLRGLSTHGTGCTHAAAITAWLAWGRPLAEAVALAKQHITRAIFNSRRAGRYDVLGWS